MELGYGQDRTQRLMREKVQDKWMDAYAPVRHLDPVLIGVTLVLALIGIVMIYSAKASVTPETGPVLARSLATRQAVSLGIGIAAMVVVAVFDYRYVRAYSAVLYLLALIGLGLVLSPLGVEVNGAQAWLAIGGFQFQPSEFAKVAVIIGVATVLHERREEPGLVTVLLALGVVALPLGLIMLQPDLGSATVFLWTAFIMLLVGGVHARYLLGLAAAAAAGIASVVRLGLLEEHQLQRLTAFLDPAMSDPRYVYNGEQSMIAIGSGQIFGKGLFHGTQTNLSYVPENHTDFIFTVVGEELGFVGATIVLGLFIVLVWRGLRIAMMAKDRFGMLLAVGTRRDDRLPGVRQRRDGHRDHARDRHPAAVRELRGHVADRELRPHRPAPQRPHAPLLTPRPPSWYGPGPDVRTRSVQGSFVHRPRRVRRAWVHGACQRSGMARTSLVAHLTALAPVLRRQFGLVTSAQARDAGVPKQRVAELCRMGLLVRRYRGVYAISTAADSWEHRAMAGFLAAGPDAVVSGLAAARILGLTHMGVTNTTPEVEFTIPRRGRRSTDGPAVVTEKHLTDVDIVAQGPWRLTSPAWTIFTQARRLGVVRTERALDAAVAAGYVTSSLAGETAARFRWCHGMPVIREVMQRHDPAVRLTRSEAERIFLRILRAAGLPLPEANVRVEDARGQRRYLDFAYLEWLIMIEIDVHGSHGRSLGRHHDGHRQNGLVPPWSPLRFDELDLVYRPELVVEDIRRALVAVGAIPASV